MPNENVPFEASYEAAKQSIISYIGEVSRVFDIPIPILNVLIYEIALESRNATFSTIISNCDVKYPEQNKADESQKRTPSPTSEPKSKTMKTEDALKELASMGIPVTDSNEPSSKSA